MKSYSVARKVRTTGGDGTDRRRLPDPETDLEIRGPGEFLGTRQSGLRDFRVANILRDGRILEEARADAFAIAESPEFQEGTTEEMRILADELKYRWGAVLAWRRWDKKFCFIGFLIDLICWDSLSR